MLTFVTAVGETTGSPASAPVETAVNVGGYSVPPPTQKPTPLQDMFSAAGTNQWAPGDVISYRVVFQNANGTTTAGPVSSSITAQQNPSQPTGWCRLINVSDIQASSDPTVTTTRLYRLRNGVSAGYQSLDDDTVFFSDGGLTAPGTIPTVNTATVPGTHYQTVPLTGLQIGPANVTARRLYRSSSGAAYKLVTTIANNTATSYFDVDGVGESGRGPADDEHGARELGPGGLRRGRIRRNGPQDLSLESES